MSHPAFAKRLLCLMALGSLAPLGVALLSQFVGGLFPCELCILQRYPYVVVAVLMVAAFLYRAQRRVLRLLLLAAMLLWMFEACLAAYHVGVEQQWWDSATGCTAQQADGDSLDDLRAAILGSPIVSCSDAGAVVLGLSMAGWNALFALSMAVGGMLLYRKSGGVHD